MEEYLLPPPSPPPFSLCLSLFSPSSLSLSFLQYNCPASLRDSRDGAGSIAAQTHSDCTSVILTLSSSLHPSIPLLTNSSILVLFSPYHSPSTSSIACLRISLVHFSKVSTMGCGNSTAASTTPGTSEAFLLRFVYALVCMLFF